MFGEYRKETITKEFVKKMVIALTVLTTVFMQSQMEVKAWWCCMYPAVSFEESVVSVTEEDGTRRGKDEMTKEDYENLTATSKVKAKWYFLEILK